MPKDITLIQPRHSYAPDTGFGHIYMPSSLMTVGAQLQAAGCDVDLYDLNLEKAQINTDVVGINLLWAPYIPEVKKLIDRIRKDFGNEIKIVLGGQVLKPGRDVKHPDAPNGWYNTGITPDQFQKLFGHNVYNGMQTKTLEYILSIPQLPAMQDTSLKDMYDNLWDMRLQEYMLYEIPLYVSQWCAQKCSFCAAVKWTPEQYRDMDAIEIDMDYLLTKAELFGIEKLNFYMTNLDVFQSPKQLFAFAKMIQEVRSKHLNVLVNMRWLAGCAYFNKAYYYEQDGEYLIEELKKAWFTTVWFGIDGISREVWKGIKKPQNTEKEVLIALSNTKKVGLTPEALMVFGHPVDTEKSLAEALRFVQWAQEEYGAIPRPHVAKAFIPGNDWRNHPDYKWAVDHLLYNPTLFQALDFTALPSYLTHFFLDDRTRNLVKEYITEMTKIPGNTTQLVEPYDYKDSSEQREEKRKKNLWKYDR